MRRGLPGRLHPSDPRRARLRGAEAALHRSRTSASTATPASRPAPSTPASPRTRSPRSGRRSRRSTRTTSPASRTRQAERGQRERRALACCCSPSAPALRCCVLYLARRPHVLGPAARRARFHRPRRRRRTPRRGRRRSALGDQRGDPGPRRGGAGRARDRAAPAPDGGALARRRRRLAARHRGAEAGAADRPAPRSQRGPRQLLPLRPHDDRDRRRPGAAARRAPRSAAADRDRRRRPRGRDRDRRRSPRAGTARATRSPPTSSPSASPRRRPRRCCAGLPDDAPAAGEGVAAISRIGFASTSWWSEPSSSAAPVCSRWRCCAPRACRGRAPESGSCSPPRRSRWPPGERCSPCCWRSAGSGPPLGMLPSALSRRGGRRPSSAARDRAGGAIVRIGQLAALQRQTAAADALGQPRLETLELGDLVVDPARPAARQPRPVALVRGSIGRQLCELAADLLERQTDRAARRR